jgi:8-oxo-dGTP pyrophosphatase MutT (NUDIX family)
MIRMNRNLARKASPLLHLAHRLYTLRAQMGRGAGLGVRIMLIQDNQVMLVKHTYQHDWFFPGGGIKHRETPLKAAVREAYEEAGAVVRDEPALLGLYSSFANHTNLHTAVFLSTDFRLETPSDRWEIDQYGLFAFDALPAGLSPGSQRRITEFQAGKRGISTIW